MMNICYKLKIAELSFYDKQKNLVLPLFLTKNLSEFIGIHIGDGHLGFKRPRNKYRYQLSGHPVKDKIYYDFFITPLFEKLFNLKVRPKLTLDGSYTYRFNSKGLFFFLKENFSLPVGKKAKIIKIPTILKKNLKFLIPCLRGIIDTDFFITFDDKVPELGAWFASRPLIEDLEVAFKRLRFKVKARYDERFFDKRTQKFYIRHRIRLRGMNNFERWMKIIGTHHPVMYSKFKYWKLGIPLKDKDIMNNIQLTEEVVPELYNSFAPVV